MKNAGSVTALHLCPGHRKPMLAVASAEAEANRGLKGDMHAIEQSTRQILLVEQETLDALSLKPGTVRENITTEGLALMKLQRGEQLRVGAAVLQITQECNPCRRMEELRPGLQDLLRGRRGMLAKVLHGGVITVGDAIHPV